MIKVLLTIITVFLVSWFLTDFYFDMKGITRAQPAKSQGGTCVNDFCTIDIDCAKRNDAYACLCCKSSPKKRQAEVFVCIDPRVPTPACR